MTERKLPSFVDGFMEYNTKLPSPPLFKKWAAIACVAGALERKVWVRARKRPLYPNLYTVLVGPPGVGKTEVTSQVWELWDSLSDGTEKGHHLSASSVTKAAMVDDLRDARRAMVKPEETPSVIQFNSLLVCANEMGTFLTAYENDFMNTLTDIYDGKPYSERRRSNKDNTFKLDKPQINILAATTPSYLNHVLPEGAWDQGFTSRTLFVYSGDRYSIPLFSDLEEEDKEGFRRLKHDIAVIGNLYGKMRFHEEAAEAIKHWDMQSRGSGGHPIPEHPKLLHYNSRRTSHLLKLCMVASASESNRLEITLEHYQLALDWLLEVEHAMPDIFKSMRGGDGKAIQEVWYFCYKEYMTHKKKPVPESELIGFLSDRVPAHNVTRILEMLEKRKVFDSVYEKGVGKCYRPNSAPPT